MRILLDSHILLWWLENPSRLHPSTRSAINNPENEAYFSAASLWELGLKRAKGKLKFRDGIAETLTEDGFQALSITVAHAERSIKLPPIHHDPFDRLLIAQAIQEGLVIATRDRMMLQYCTNVIEA